MADLFQQLVTRLTAAVKVDGFKIVQLDHQQISVRIGTQHLADIRVQGVHQKCTGQLVKFALKDTVGNPANHPLGNTFR